MISIADKIAAVERLIEDLRWARADPDVPEHATYCALKEIALELRAPERAGPVLRGMTHQVDAAKRNKIRFGFIDAFQKDAIAEGVCGNWWPVIQKALESFENKEQRHAAASDAG